MPDLRMTMYNSAPIWVQNVLTTVQGAALARRRYGAVYRSYLRELGGRDHSNALEQKQYQDHRFVELVNYAVANSPFYRDYYASIDLTSIEGVQDIARLPILPKETVRRNIGQLYTLPREEGIVSNTSGTTGTSISFVHTQGDMQKRLAYLDSFKARHGFIANKMRRASFTTAKIVPRGQRARVFWRDNLSIRQRLYSGYHCRGSNVKYYVENLNEYRPQSLDGLPSSLYELARFILENNICLSFVPVAIFPTAETLLPHYRSAIEKAFGCPVRDQYSSSEGAPFITECTHGRLHYNTDTGIIELGSDGEMIVTGFETHGTPLIRYMIGDRVLMGGPDETCECGSSHPLVKEIQGRSADYLVSRSNGRFTAIYLSLVSEEFMNSVRRMQFVQNTIGEIEILVEGDARYRPEMNNIIAEKLTYSFGADMQFRIRIVDEIPKDPSGKCRFIVNNVQID